jgi:hypothetical protein
MKSDMLLFILLEHQQLALDLGKFPIVCGGAFLFLHSPSYFLLILTRNCPVRFSVFSTDCPGFVVNRILGIYMNEAGILCMEGQKITHVDAALLNFGMPMGPFVRSIIIKCVMRVTIIVIAWFWITSSQPTAPDGRSRSGCGRARRPDPGGRSGRALQADP